MSLSPTQRTLRALRDQGMVCAIVEKFNPYVGPHGIRQDLFGCIDVLALDPERGVIGIQSCGQSFSEHKHKLLEERTQEVSDWLSTPGTELELWGVEQGEIEARRQGYEVETSACPAHPGER